MGLHQTFVKFLMDRAPSASGSSGRRYPGTPQKRAPEGEITQRKESGGISKNRRTYTRPRLRKVLRKDSGKVPGMGAAYTRKQREEIEVKDFPKEKYGTHVSKYEWGKRIKELKLLVRSTNDLRVRAEARKKIKLLERLKGDER